MVSLSGKTRLKPITANNSRIPASGEAQNTIRLEKCDLCWATGPVKHYAHRRKIFFFANSERVARNVTLFQRPQNQISVLPLRSIFVQRMRFPFLRINKEINQLVFSFVLTFKEHSSHNWRSVASRNVDQNGGNKLYFTGGLFSTFQLTFESLEYFIRC